jgi:NDP-sugar pyrophosphorylase family protein
MERGKAVENGAIILVGSSSESRDCEDSLGIGSLECIEVAGRSSLERMLERFEAIGIETISVLVTAKNWSSLRPFRSAHPHATIQVVSDLEAAVRGQLASYKQRGLRHTFVSWASVYVETDLLDLLCFHAESKQALTPTYNNEGALSLWVADCAKVGAALSENSLEDAGEASSSRYFVREYAISLKLPAHIRRLASDILSRRCQTDPSGQQVRPGVWMDEGAEVHRRSRIVAPAYIGCESRIKADALITRLSDIERNCLIDSGTVIEDSSVLENTSVGICLDVCHSVASGNRLLNLERDVVVEISDSHVMKPSVATRTTVAIESVQGITDLPTSPMPAAWQLENI